MRRTLALLGFILALAACQSPPAPVEDAPPDAAETRDDSCGSQRFALLLGRDRTQAPASTDAHPVRVVCSTCPMTMDYNAQRLNVIYDEKTGVVQSLTCG